MGRNTTWGFPIVIWGVVIESIGCRGNEVHAAHRSDENLFSRSFPLMFPSLYSQLRQLSVRSLDMLIRP